VEGIGRVVVWVVASLLGECCGRECAPVEAEPSAIGERYEGSSNWSLRFIRMMFRGRNGELLMRAVFGGKYRNSRCLVEVIRSSPNSSYYIRFK